MILLKLWPYALLMIAFIIAILWQVGKKQSKEAYKKDYERLVMYVRDGLITRPNHQFIVFKFKEIEKYKYRDKESLRLLREEFDKRYEVFNTLPDEHSPEAVYGKV